MVSYILWIFDIGYIFQHVGTFTQIKKIERKKSTEGVCVDTQILFLIGTLARVFWVSDTQLRNFWLTYVELILAFITLIYSLYLCLYKYSYTNFLDSLNRTEVNFLLRWYPIFLYSVVLAFFFFPGNEGQWWDIQMLVSLNMYIEAGGLIPQIILTNKEKDSNNFASLYLVFLCISRVMRLIFWLKMYFDGNGFIYLILADLFNCIMVSGFVWSFFQNLDKFSLPTQIDERSQNKRIF